MFWLLFFVIVPPLLDNGGLESSLRSHNRQSEPDTRQQAGVAICLTTATVSGSLRRLLFVVPVLILAYLFLLRLKNNAVSIPAREMTITILHSKIFVLSPVLTAVSGFVEVVGCSLLEIIEMTAISL